MRLDEFKVGEMYFVNRPNVRLARVEKEGTWTFDICPDAPAGDNQDPNLTRRCLRVLCTTPDVEITGHVTKAGAKRNANIKSMAKGQTEDREWDYRVWEEVWCERKVGRLETVPGGKAMVRADLNPQGGTPSRYEMQTFCAAVLDLQGNLLTGPNRKVARSPFRSSSIPGAAVEGASHVSKGKVKGDPFTLVEDEKKDEKAA